VAVGSIVVGSDWIEICQPSRPLARVGRLPVAK
jgi:hypothetical protein